VQPEGVKELVGQEGGAGYIADVLEDREAEEQYHDERYEGEHAADPAYDAVDHQRLKETRRYRRLCPAGCMCTASARAPWM
jgi:hypothetical protein